MIVSNYRKGKLEEFFPFAVESLQLLSKQSDICLILYTSSHQRKIDTYLEKFKNLGIKFAYVNENPEECNTEYANFDRKFYFNVLFDDKGGFDPLEDWEPVYNFLKKLYS